MRCTYRDIRRLLRRVRDPAALEVDPLGVALRDSLGLASVFDAMLHLVNVAFTDAARDRVLYDIVYHCDFEGEQSDAVAKRIAVSLRHFFRYRATAMNRLAALANRMIIAPDRYSDQPLEMLGRLIGDARPQVALRILGLAEPNLGENATFLRLRLRAEHGDMLNAADLAMLGGYWRDRALLLLAEAYERHSRVALASEIAADVASRLNVYAGDRRLKIAYGLAWVKALVARRYHHVSELRTLGLELLSLARGEDNRILHAHLVAADGATRAGEAAEARVHLETAERLATHRRQPVGLALTLNARAEIALLAGSGHDGLLLSEAAFEALVDRPLLALVAAATHARAVLASGAQWTPPFALLAAFPRSAQRPEIEAAWAEALLRRGELEESVRYASQALQLASDLGAPAAQMAALKALAAIESSRGNERAAHELRSEAAKVVAARGDAVLIKALSL